MFFDELPNFDENTHDINIRVSMRFKKALGGLQEPFFSLRCDKFKPKYLDDANGVEYKK